ncbi:MAG: hypothetical protein GXY48_00530 [Methanomicrobiales archaeon]|nr:hypothetical protein [Methanomicrobiales archaeon]
MTPVSAQDMTISDNFTKNDTEFLFMMNQYWIPDLFEIKGRIDNSLSYDVSDMLNLSVDYAQIRLMKNVNETKAYNISPDLSALRQAYYRTVTSELMRLKRLPALNRSEINYEGQVSSITARLPLYGSWLEYQVMQRYNIHNRNYPELATVPANEFFSIMANMT